MIFALYKGGETMSFTTILLISLGTFALGALLTGLFFFIRDRWFFASAKQEALNIINQATEEAERIKKNSQIQVREEIVQTRAEIEKEIKDKKADLQVLERRLLTKEENLENRTNNLEQKEQEIKEQTEKIKETNDRLEKKLFTYDTKLKEIQQSLEKISGFTVAEAKEMQIEMIVEEARKEASKRFADMENELKRELENKSRKIIATAIQRYAPDYVVDRTISTVSLPSDEMKGRIIGREGRNIRAIEAATGVDLIIDDTPETVVISSFDPFKRELARASLEKLISDGRIHPARIEEIVLKTSKEIEKEIMEAADKAIFDLGLPSIHPELMRLLGTLKFRTSYTQNQYLHSLEVAFIAGVIASEIGADQKKAKIAGLLHDIGKAVNHSVDGSHAKISGDYARKYGIDKDIIHAIEAHHEEIKPESVLDVILIAADALSGARPGARKEVLESYVKRLEELEEVSSAFDGVDKVYAIQAGREVRVIVKSEEVSDADASLLSSEIAKKIEKDVSYPGQVKVTVIRETRSVGVAK